MMKRFGNLLVDTKLVKAASIHSESGSEEGFVLLEDNERVPASAEDVWLLLDYLDTSSPRTGQT